MFCVKRWSIFLVLALAALMTGCGRNSIDEVDFGGFTSGSVYTNRYFGLKVPIPSSWSIQDQEAQRRLIKTGGKLMAGDDKNLKAALKAAEMQTVPLFTVLQHPLGTPGAYNPNIVGVAEQVRQLPGIKKGSDYLYHAKKLMQSGQLEMSIADEFHPRKIGGVDFDVMDMQMAIGGLRLKQKYHVAIVKGYALGMIISFSNDEQEAALEKILDGVRFDSNPNPPSSSTQAATSAR
ncbi:MAG TPA: hypothetical protein VNT26_07985 [Candidatus Sulfotelmatobacter sp.]|nr:hypothetical protein [Candidatus Sulfotelmatobacter sp.]